MEMTLEGTVNGNLKQINLDRELNLPAGTRVSIKIKTKNKKKLTLEEKRKLVDKFCGAWADDPSINKVFEEIDRERHQDFPREVDFDAAP